MSWLDSSLYHEDAELIDKVISPKVLLSCGILQKSLKGAYGVKRFNQTYIDILDMYIKNKVLNVPYSDWKTTKFFMFYHAFIQNMKDESYKDNEEQQELSWSKLKSEKNFIKIILLFFSYIPELSTPKTEIDLMFSRSHFSRYAQEDKTTNFINDIKLLAFRKCLLFPF